MNINNTWKRQVEFKKEQWASTLVITRNIIVEVAFDVQYVPNMNIINQLPTVVDKVKDDQGSVEALVEKKLETKWMSIFPEQAIKNQTTL